MSQSKFYAATGGSLLAFGLAVVSLGALGLGPDTPAFWYLSRSAGLVAYALLWLNVVAGLLLSGRLLRQVLAPALIAQIHQTLSVSALGFALFHGLVLLGDRYAGLSLMNLLVPFSGTFHPLTMAGGQLSAALLAILLISSGLRKTLGNRAWRALHYTAFGAYWLALAHAVALGSDSMRPAVGLFYGVTGICVLWLTTARILLREGAHGR
jgi:predicted ferric reductase